ncbi:DUF3450 domain-containing protein [Pseudodesulfovibrio sediminis]|uniref:DUF3450 domain-containing protein n=1 Tax=Pseudodesulfovibrio sediminis TaxID=2810563 RepID=A0ABM7P461_9BACT|nr:DUF3450 domain-containing protein [Pseudodesulfovibrio sediminis]BCS87634.1 DUF3450 domain-containing protein [Pseudodesulfovibrio sediminis]
MFTRCIFLLFMLLTLPGAASAASAKAVQNKAEQAIAVEASAQKQYLQWTDRKETMAAEIRDMKATESWLEFQNRKYANYVKKQEEVIAELQRRKEEAKRIKMELEPELETVVDRLERFVAADLPFLVEERRQRIQFLRDSLNDYHLLLSEKLRRVFEALLVETEYGRNIATSTQELTINGQQTVITVFRLGRTALFYQTADGAEVGYWDRTSKDWVLLNEDYSHTLRQARDMAERKRAVELLDLPIGAY